MRRQFYESRGEEMPEGLDVGDVSKSLQLLILYHSTYDAVDHDADSLDDEHARALEEQWIEGDLTAETATSKSPSPIQIQNEDIGNWKVRVLTNLAASSDGMYSDIMYGLLTGFLWPILPILLFRDPPLPNFFDADAEAASAGEDQVGSRVAGSVGVGGETLPSVVFGQRMQVGPASFHSASLPLSKGF